MVYFEPTDLGLTPLFKNWYNSMPKLLPASVVELIEELFEFSLQKGFGFIEKRKGCTSFPFHQQHVTNLMFAITSAFLEFFDKTDGFADNETSTKSPVSNGIQIFS
jgi:hypothetical protein